MNSNYPDPAYQAELEKEAMLKMIESLQSENEKLKGTVQQQNQKANKQNEELALLKTKLVRREFTIATKIENIYGKVKNYDWHEGVVITAPLNYEGTNKYPRGDIRSFSWIYCQKLGLIRSMNAEEVSMKFGHFYYFKCNDQRNKMEHTHRKLTHMNNVRAVKNERRIFRHITTIENGKLFFQVYFDIDASQLYDDMTVYLEDRYLNRVHLNGRKLGEIFTMTGNSKIEGRLNIKTKVGLKKKFLERFHQDPNNPLFEVVEVQKITFESGRKVEVKKTEDGRTLYISSRR